MKKIAALVLCLVLMGSLFAGCQQKPKEIPPCFPHSNSVRLDASEEEIKALDVTDGITEHWYNAVSHVSIDHIPFQLIYRLNVYNEITASYVNNGADGMDTQKAYNQLVDYFSEIYGKGSKKTEWYDYELNPTGMVWEFKIDTEAIYRLTLSLTSSVNDEASDPQRLDIQVGLADVWKTGA